MNDKLLLLTAAVVGIALLLGVQSTVATSPLLQTQVQQQCAAFGGCPSGPALQAIPSPTASAAQVVGGVQKVSVRALSTGLYDNRVITVKAGVPVELSFSADANAGCGRQFVMRDFGVNEIARGTEVKIIRFTPQTPGTFEYACGMRMFRGKLIVTS